MEEKVGENCADYTNLESTIIKCEEIDIVYEPLENVSLDQVEIKDKVEKECWYDSESCDVDIKSKDEVDEVNGATTIEYITSEVIDIEDDPLEVVGEPFAVNEELWTYDCDNTSEKYHLNDHSIMYLDRSGKKMYRCDMCDFKTPKRFLLKRHQSVHERVPDIHKCKYCEFKTRWMNNLKLHELIHEFQQMHKCDICDFSTKYRAHLKLHKVTHKSENVAHKPENITHKPENIRVLYECTLCSYSTKSKRYFNKHCKTHIEYSCDVCNYTTKLKCTLEKHKLSHKAKNKKIRQREEPDDIYICNDCGFELNKKDFLQHLSYRNSSRVKTYKCSFARQ